MAGRWIEPAFGAALMELGAKLSECPTMSVQEATVAQVHGHDWRIAIQCVCQKDGNGNWEFTFGGNEFGVLLP